MRHFALALIALLGCRPTASATPQTPPATPPESPRVRLPVAAEPAVEPVTADEPSALEQAVAIIDAVKIRSDWVSDDKAEELAVAGLTPELCVAALEQLLEDCEDRRNPTCGHLADTARVRRILLHWIEDRGDETAAPVLLAFDHFGEYRGGMALETIMGRRAVATQNSCVAPTPEAVTRLLANLGDFVVLDNKGGVLTGRAPTAREFDDLAYFLVAVSSAGPEVGVETGVFRSGDTPSKEETLDRTAHLASLAHAKRTGDFERMLQAGSLYLHSLGFPGDIDRSREADVAWGGARFSYVMRDVALAAELTGDFDTAATLYRRANPGGGMCGTSVSARRGDQLKGLMRAAEGLGKCEMIIPERLMNWEGTAESPYGPKRLADAGFDIERLYRGALVTRHRNRDAAIVRAAIERAPVALREPALARLTERGPEAWERRVWAIEGLPAELGRRGVEAVLPLLSRLDNDAQARAIAAVGSAGRRFTVGSCPDNIWGFGLSGSNVWSRSVPPFAESCPEAYTDAEVARLHRTLKPFLHSDSPDVRAATIQAIGDLAPRRVLRSLRRELARAQRLEAQCKAKDDADCWALSNLASTAASAIERVKRLETDAAEAKSAR